MRRHAFRFILLGSFLLLVNLGKSAAQSDSTGTLVEGRAVWAHPSSVAFNDSATVAFVEHCKKANINLIVLLVEFSDKQVYYHSKKFPETLVPAFKDFDPLAAVIREAHKRGIRVHAWLCDFTQSSDGPVMQNHPEWAMRNPDGKIPSEAEFLGGGVPYRINWMCPARRPGYTDQWLLPMIEEIVTDYDVDGIHHDYVRYPGDVAPDSYCFCDYCLDEMLKYAHFYYESFPDSVFPATPTFPNAEANWQSDPTVKPKGWDRWDRKKKADFFLKGSFMKGGPSDMDDFFYAYRQDAINRFVREAWERASAIKPNIEFSAAVFKNPVTSGRFIGQQWTEFAPWVDVMMPMVYRSHFPRTDFETFLKMLEEYTRYEYRWAKGRTRLSVGLDVHYIYDEERFFLSDALHLADSLASFSKARRLAYVQRLRSRFSLVKDHLSRIAPDLENKLASGFSALPNLAGDRLVELQQLVTSMNADLPEDYYPKEKLRRAIEAVRKGGGNGIAIFDAGGLTSRKLWPVLEDLFKEPSIEPYRVGPAAQMSIARVKMDRQRLEASQRGLWILGGVTVLLLATLALIAWKSRSTN
jgi:uncharacterized lipoprotein YddW (UPF0748 family)